MWSVTESESRIDFEDIIVRCLRLSWLSLKCFHSITGQKSRELRNLLQIQPLSTVLRVQAIRSKQLRNIYNCYIHGSGAHWWRSSVASSGQCQWWRSAAATNSFVWVWVLQQFFSPGLWRNRGAGFARRYSFYATFRPTASSFSQCLFWGTFKAIKPVDMVRCDLEWLLRRHLKEDCSRPALHFIRGWSTADI